MYLAFEICLCVCVCVGINLCKDKDITENGVIINEAE